MDVGRNGTKQPGQPNRSWASQGGRRHTGGDLNTLSHKVLWVAWSPAVQLSEVLAVLQLQNMPVSVPGLRVCG